MRFCSSDAIAAGSTGTAREVYVARVAIPPEQLQRVSGFKPTPGMPAEILIQTQARTFFDYLTKPISDSMSRAFREN